jgi:hypothetical protein
MFRFHFSFIRVINFRFKMVSVRKPRCVMILVNKSTTSDPCILPDKVILVIVCRLKVNEAITGYV